MNRVSILLVIFMRTTFSSNGVVQFIRDVCKKWEYKSVSIIVEDGEVPFVNGIRKFAKEENRRLNVVNKKNLPMIWNLSCKIGCVYFLSVDDTADIIEKIYDSNEEMLTIHDWFMLGSTDDGSWTKSLTYEIALDSNVFVINFINDTDIAHVSEIYNLGGKGISNKLGIWSKSKGFQLSHYDRLARRSDLQGLTLKAVFLEETGFTKLDESAYNPAENLRNIDAVPWVGPVPDIFNNLAFMFNFSYELSEPRDGKWGAISQDGEWNGMIRDLIDGVADIAPSSLSVTKARSSAVNFALPFKAEMNGIFIARQSSLYTFDIFKRPFTDSTWIVLSLLMLLLSIITFFISKAGNEFYRTEFTLSKSVIFVLGAYGSLATRRWSVTPTNPSLRIIFLTIVLLGCLNHWHWKASIISHLSVVRRMHPFNSLEELVLSPYQVSTIADSYYQAVWQETDSRVYQDVWRTKFMNKEKSLKSSEQEVVDQALSGPYAIYLFHTTLSNLPEYSACQLEDAGLQLNRIDLAFALQKQSPYVNLINLGLQRMAESGKLERIFRKHRAKKPSCGAHGKGKSLGFENILLVFLILMLGQCSSIVLLLLEKLSVCFIRSLCRHSIFEKYKVCHNAIKTENN